MKISFRQATQEDYQFLYGLKVASMREYVERVYGWDEAFQSNHFQRNFRPRDLSIIKNEGRNVGMIEVFRDEDGLFIKRIEILPEAQNHGIGTQVIERILSENESANARLMVFKVNPARKLYERLGFIKVAETDTHFKMVRQN